jgi:hypothetical protein
MDETEAHSSYRLGSPLASIAGIAESMLDGNDLDEELTTRLRAIRDLAIGALQADRADLGSQPQPQKQRPA